MKNPAFDAYIAKAAPFARPILEKVRRLFHRACPGIEEKLKWGMPSFEYKGIVGGAAAFKNHAVFGFWRQDVLPDPEGLFKTSSPMGAKITDVAQLPSDAVLLAYIRRAVALNEKGAPPRVKARPKPPPKMPADLQAALRKNRKAQTAFDAFPPSHRREYIDWIVDAKQAETRKRRLETTVEWAAQGKARNWKYMKKK